MFCTPWRKGWQLALLFTLIILRFIPPATAAPTGRQHLIVHVVAVHSKRFSSDLTLADTDGKTCHLAQLRGKPLALFFFCGCPWCQHCAETWGQFQRGGALPLTQATSLKVSPTTAMTLVVFSGNANAARAFEAQTGLDPAQTLMLPDPDLRVTTAYHADPCPRAFVLDAQGHLRYTNHHADDAPRQASALAIASRTLDALRAGSAPTSEGSFPVTTLAGKPLDLATLPGWKVIYFWSATCPCVRACESFTFIPLSRCYEGKVSFFAVASNGYDLKQSPGYLTHQIKQHNLPFPVVFDSQHQVAATLNAKVTPQAFLLSPQNEVVFAGIPDDSRRYQARTGSWGVSKSYLAQAIKQALAGKPVTVPRMKDEGCIITW